MHFLLRQSLLSLSKRRLQSRLTDQHTRRLYKAMRLVQFEAVASGRRGLGVELEDGNANIVDLTESVPELPNNMNDFIAGGEANLEAAKRAVDAGRNILKQGDIRILSPINNPEKLICIGMNYRDHCAEQNVPVPVEPVIFSKFNSAIRGPNDTIEYPNETSQLDWEVELAVIIGKEGKNIAKEEAMNFVFGYTVAHDVSARDWQLQRNGNQFLVGKSMDGFCPLGPAIVTKEALLDPHNLRLWTKVNGVYKQDSNTSQLVFKTEELVAFLSRFFTLKPGDTILTGTPPGVGVFRNPPEFLKKGDVVEVGIEKIGALTNAIV
ncbi:unnamed protein product [Lymnaea stagnalis]|uniref:Fumarylacetoacetase-like C-terminal domain-containing protein n=1 Tax=Lymnaea stagnalis TaxID=6523 RepID=A0AAV2I2N8_LYMST